MHELAQAFYELYRAYDGAHGVFTISEFNQVKGKWEGQARTKLEQPSIQHWLEHLQGSTGLGLIPLLSDNTCSWGVIDIDEYDLNIDALNVRIKELGLPLITLRTKSGGAHVSVFFTEPIQAHKLRAKLTVFADMLGHPSAEIFPKQSYRSSSQQVGNWINMPYYEAERTLRYCVNDTASLTAADFIALANEHKVTPDVFDAIEFEGAKEFTDAPPCLAKLAVLGIEQGARTNALFNYGVYVRNKFPDDWEHKLEELNSRLISPPLMAREVINTVKQLKKKKYFYKCNDQPIAGHCNKQLCKGRKYGVGQSDDTDELPYVLGTLHKLDMNPPMWWLDVDGKKLDLSTEDLLSQAKFQKACVEKLNKFPKAVKPARWQSIIANLLEHAMIIETPDDASADGRLMGYVESFLRRPLGHNIGQLLRDKCIIEGERIYFRGSALMRYLRLQRFNELTEKQIYSILRGKGAAHSQRNIKGRCIQLWDLSAPTKEQDDIKIEGDTNEPF